jgi:putative membrane protein
MKNSKIFCNNFLPVVLGTATLIGVLAFSSVSQLDQPVVTISSIVKTDAEFLKDAAEINLEEIKLGQLAQTKSTMSDVKELGRMMEREHQKSLKELTTLASKKGISVPNSVSAEANEKYNALNSKSEKKFNDDYCDMMIKGHKHAISLFETASKDATDPEIRQWAASTLPTLHAHLDHSKMCKEKCEKMQ